VPVETTVTRCGNCGATLERTPGAESIRCGFCNQSTWLAPTVTATAEPRPPRPRETASADVDDLLDRLARGPLREVTGQGARLNAQQAPLTDPMLLERALWPVGAEASSTFGGSWSPSTMIGTPRVYPRSGDISGAWAPGPQVSPVEWVEVAFNTDVPVSAVRVFETNRAGSAYAVVDTTQGETLLYARPIEDRSGAAVLEVRFDAPRVIRSLRVYVVNRGWTEIDAVCLLAAAPLPIPMRTPMAKPTGAMAIGTALALVGAGAAALVVAVLFLAARSSLPSTERPLPVVSAAVAGARLSYRAALPAGTVQWAAAVVESSSEFSSTRNAAVDALGAPDVYPRSGDVDGAWAPLQTDGGHEWITVRFAAPVRAASIVWVETFNPGAVIRVDDLSDPSAPASLWGGATSAPTGAAVAELTLAGARTVSAVRIVLDTRRVSGWNELDAIGLVPAAQ
jgi:LSD1 subclass zinc finger protein